MPPSPAYADDVAVSTSQSGVAWAAIFGGALAAVGVTLILTPLHTGLGFASVSPWNSTEPGKTLSIVSIVWLIVAQWISAGLGGYLTGRLRKKWGGAHTHEVFFRDTVHGFLAWALASIAGVVFIILVASHMHSPMDHRGGERDGSGPETYTTDTLFRPVKGVTEVPDADRRQAQHILMEGVKDKTGIPEDDRIYLAQLISAHAGVSPADAEARIDRTVTQQKAMMDKARKAAATGSIIFALSLLVGAFVASVAGALGGRDRDMHYETGRLTPL